MNNLRMTLQTLAAAERSAPPKGPWLPAIHLTPPHRLAQRSQRPVPFPGRVFYQYAPFDAGGGLKFWGHYKNLVSWEQCPAALCPDQDFDLHGVYSGSALCEEDGLYLYYTGNVRHEGAYDYVRAGRDSSTALAFSPDGAHIAWKRLLMRNEDYPPRPDAARPGPEGVEAGREILHGPGGPDPGGRGRGQALRLYVGVPGPLRGGQWFLLACPQGAGGGKPGLENKYACGYFPLLGDFRGGCALREFVPLDYGFDFYTPWSCPRPPISSLPAGAPYPWSSPASACGRRAAA